MALTKKQRAELRMKFGGRCAYCGCELSDNGTLTTSKRCEEISVTATQWTDLKTTPSTIWFRHVYPATCSKCAARLRIFAIALQLKLM